MGSSAHPGSPGSGITAAGSGDRIVAVDIGGTRLRLGMTDARGRLLESESRPSAVIDHPSEGPSRLSALLEEQVAAWGCARELRALALGFPSTVSRDRRVVLQTPNLRGFDHAPIADLVQRKFGVPVLLERDVTFLLAYDMEALGIGPAGTVIGIYFGTGIGNAVCLEGSFHAGKNGVAGELGHIPMRGAGGRCGCGNIGCAETVASGRRLAEIAAAEFPGEDISGMFERHASAPAMEAFLEDLALVAAMEINILDPDHVVIGGGVPQMRSFPRDELRRRIGGHLRRPLPAESLSLRFSPQQEFAGVLGGARLAARALQAATGGTA